MGSCCVMSRKKGRGEYDEKEIVILSDESLRKNERMLL